MEGEWEGGRRKEAEGEGEDGKDEGGRKGEGRRGRVEGGQKR